MGQHRNRKSSVKILQAIFRSKQKGQQCSLQRRIRKIPNFNLNTKKHNQLHKTNPRTTRHHNCKEDLFYLKRTT